MDARLNSLPSSRNPFVHALSLIVAAVMLVGAALLGAFILAIALGIGLVFALVIFGRVWWIRRKIAAAQRSGGQPFGASHSASSGGRQVIDVEYTVVEVEPDESGPPR